MKGLAMGMIWEMWVLRVREGTLTRGMGPWLLELGLRRIQQELFGYEDDLLASWYLLFVFSLAFLRKQLYFFNLSIY
jgi:hypothetical protein